MAERARTQRVKPIVRQGRRPEQPLDNVQRVGTEVPHPTRGTTDTEGQLFIHGKALESYPEAASAAPDNVKFPIEVEEEVSTPGLAPFIKNNLNRLKTDVCVISDSSICAMEQPHVTPRLPCMAQIQVEVLEPKDDLHSGFWGGAAHNPAHVLVAMLSKPYKPDSAIAVPDSHDDFVSLTPDERKMLAKTARNEEQSKKTTGLPPLRGDQNYTICERVSARSKFDINGFGHGYFGPGPRRSFQIYSRCSLVARIRESVGTRASFHACWRLSPTIRHDEDFRSHDGLGSRQRSTSCRQ